MSASADWNASVCGGLAAALLDACGGEPDAAAEWVAGAYAPSWGEVASALDDLRAAREHLSALIVAATPCEGCGSAAGIGCAYDCDPDAGAWRCSCLCGCDSWLPALRQQTCDTCHDRCVGSGAFPAPAVTT